MLCENPTLCYSCCDFILIHLQHPGGDLGTDRSVWVLLGTIHLTRFSEWKHFSAPTCLPSPWGFSILAPVVCCSVPVACHRGGCPEPNGICSLQGHRWGNWKKGSQNLFTALIFWKKNGKQQGGAALVGWKPTAWLHLLMPSSASSRLFLGPVSQWFWGCCWLGEGCSEVSICRGCATCSKFSV